MIMIVSTSRRWRPIDGTQGRHESPIQTTLASLSPTLGGSNLQFKQHPNVAKFTPGPPRVVALKDSWKAGDVLGMMRVVPLFVCKTNWNQDSLATSFQWSIEYELEKENVTLYDVIISIPLPYVSVSSVLDALDCQFPVMVPTLPSHSDEWSFDPAFRSRRQQMLRLSSSLISLSLAKVVWLVSLLAELMVS